MSNDDRRWQDLFEEMMEAPGRETGDADARGEMPDEMADFLLMARQLQDIGKQKMPDADAALNRARERVLASIPAPAAATAPAAPPIWQRWRLALAPVLTPAMSWAPAMLIIALTFTVSLGIAIYASENALPNSPLYPVKQASEKALLLLTPPDKREQRLVAINQERARELLQAQSQGMNVEIPYEGEVQDCEGDTCIIDGVKVKVNQKEGELPVLKSGDKVKMLVHVNPEATLVAKDVVLEQLSGEDVQMVAEAVTAHPPAAESGAVSHPQAAAKASLEPKPESGQVKLTPTRKPTRKPAKKKATATPQRPLPTATPAPTSAPATLVAVLPATSLPATATEAVASPTIEATPAATSLPQKETATPTPGRVIAAAEAPTETETPSSPLTVMAPSLLLRGSATPAASTTAVVETAVPVALLMPTATSTPLPLPTNTPAPTATPAPTHTPTQTATATVTVAPKLVFVTNTPTFTPTYTPTRAPATPTFTPTKTPTRKVVKKKPTRKPHPTKKPTRKPPKHKKPTKKPSPTPVRVTPTPTATQVIAGGAAPPATKATPTQAAKASQATKTVQKTATVKKPTATPVVEKTATRKKTATSDVAADAAPTGTPPAPKATKEQKQGSRPDKSATQEADQAEKNKKSTPEPKATRKPDSAQKITATPRPDKKKKAPEPRATAKPDDNRKYRTISGVISRVYKSGGKVKAIRVGRVYVRMTSDTAVKGKIAKGKKATVKYYVKKGRRYAAAVVVKGSAADAAQKTPEPKATAKPDDNRKYRTLSGVSSRVYKSGGRVKAIRVGRVYVRMTSDTVVKGKIAKGKKATVKYYVKKGRRYAAMVVVKGSAKNPSDQQSDAKADKKTPKPKPTAKPKPKPTETPVPKSESGSTEEASE